MDYLQSIICGFIQGAAEFLPISSSGHLSLFKHFFGMQDISNSFDVLLHLGTLFAIFIVYSKDIFPLIPAFFTMIGKVFKRKFKLEYYTTQERMVIMIIIACIPLLPTALIEDNVEALGTYPIAIGVILLINSVMLFISDNIKGGSVNAETIKPRNAITVGFFQMFAVLPGLSRSGSTITGGLINKFDREYAVKFSFIMSIPAILGANIIKLPELIKDPSFSSNAPMYIVGTLTALVVGVGAMKLLIFISRKSTFKIFSVYCAIVGLLAIILAALGVTFA